MDAEPASVVVRRRDDSASLRVAADHERNGGQARIFEFLDRGEERVQIEVGDDHTSKDRPEVR
jgi:hypothetical protein